MRIFQLAFWGVTACNVLLPFAFGLGCADAADVLDPSRFEITELVSQLNLPMDLVIAPDGSVYFIELSGTIRCWRPETAQVDVVGQIAVTTEQENGLIGITLDPAFATNGWIYLQYSPPDYSGQQISRWTLRERKLDTTSEQVLLRFEEQRKECCHHAGTIQFGPDGCLYIATGDNTHPAGDSQGFAPLDERPERAPYDAQKSSSNTMSLNGKILRIRPLPDGSYAIPEGNLFPVDGMQGRPEIFVMGCRNPWRMHVDPRTGYCYWGDVGPDAGGDGERGSRGYDEINQARAAGNFGWPYFIGDNRPYADVDFATGTIGPLFDPAHPVNASPNNTGARDLPPAQPAWIFYPYGPSTQFPELGQGGRTACAGPVYYFESQQNSTTKFPAAMHHVLFAYDWSRNWIKAVYLDENDQIIRIEPFLDHIRWARPIDIEFGPEGSMYLIEYGETWGVNANARLVRIDYLHGNRPPRVQAAARNNLGKEPLTVSFSSAGTTDPDAGDQLRYEWHRISLQGDERTDHIFSREPHPTETFSQPGVYQVELHVTDASGASRAASVPVLVGNTPPEVTFTLPHAADFFDPTQPLRFELQVRDSEDGTNDAELEETLKLDPLDPDSPNRTTVNAALTRSPIPPQSPDAENQEASNEPLGMRLMKASDCFNCHAVDSPRVGPPLQSIAMKYRGVAGAIQQSVERVLKGSSGVWGKVPMIPHGQHTESQIREMVAWVYTLHTDEKLQIYPGFVGEIPPLGSAEEAPGHYVLTAQYIDRGHAGVPPLTAASTIYVRTRHVEAEAADVVAGPRILESSTAQSGKFLGSIDHGHSLRLHRVPLDTVRRIDLRVASGGAGGRIIVRLDSSSGPEIGSIDVIANGQWEDWKTASLPIPPTKGIHDLYIHFTHPNQAAALMNLDFIFLAAE